MIDIVMIGAVAIAGTAALIVDRAKSRKFNSQVDQVNLAFDTFMDEHDLEKLDVILRDEEIFLAEKSLKKSKKKLGDIMIPLRSNSIPSTYDFVVKNLFRHQVSPIHKHDHSQMHVYVVRGEIELSIYPDEDLTCENGEIVKLKKGHSFSIYPGIYHSMKSRWGARIIVVYIPSLIRMDSTTIGE
jgi:mannose-6-phosphate isomerase-like protein (cupin superfamily)